MKLCLHFTLSVGLHMSGKWFWDRYPQLVALMTLAQEWICLSGPLIALSRNRFAPCERSAMNAFAAWSSYSSGLPGAPLGLLLRLIGGGRGG